MSKKFVAKIFKIQSAMEYLMTYGWSILIIAIITIVLYQLGIFGSSNLGPSATPGSCIVFRPGGPGTVQNINLEGQCQGLVPKGVAFFNGASSIVSTPLTGLPLGSNDMSIFAWIYTTQSVAQGQYQVVYVWGSDATHQTGLVLRSLQVAGERCNGIDLPGTTTLSLNTWYFIGLTYNSMASQFNYYLNSAPDGTHVFATCTTGGAGYIGSRNTQQWFNGTISNVQVYNESLSQNAINALYQEGIGGAPTDISHVVGWWPLNGDLKDYSGNNNNGAPTNVLFRSQWTAGYTIP